MVHDYMYQQMFGQSFQDKVTCCGGFAILKGGRVRYSSVWLNMQTSSTNRLRWESDGNKMLSKEEEVLVDLALKTWTAKGPNSIVDVPEEIDAVFRVASLAL